MRQKYKMKSLTILKIGGNVIDNPKILESVLRDFAEWQNSKLLVHGGGKIADKLLLKLGITPTMVDGRRVTDSATLDVVTMVYAGLINKQIVAKLQSYSCNAIGLSGADANVILAQKRQVVGLDYGFVGDLETANVSEKTLTNIFKSGFVPVIAPITHDGKGILLNTNADDIASSVASAMAKNFSVQLVYCFEKAGVLHTPDDENSVIDFLDTALYERYKEQGIFTAGMLPKLNSAFAALHNGVDEIRICNPEGIKQGGTRIKL